MGFYHDADAWTFPRNCLPTNDDVIRFYISRVKNNKNKSAAKAELVKLVHNIWESAQCCPVGRRHIGKKFEDLYGIYSKYLKQGREKKSHKRKERSEPPPKPTRKSSRRVSGKKLVYSAFLPS